MAGSAARVAAIFFDDVLSEPSNAISGGSEEQKRHSNALAAARERAKAMRPPPADPPRQPAQEATPQPTAAQTEEKDSLSRALQRLRDMKPARPRFEKDDEKKLDRHKDRERDR
jgi:hypothetical protein